jgi:hypothetical protein
MTRAEHLLDRMHLVEASISRLIKTMKGDDFALISAHRAVHSKDKNRERNKEMMDKHFRPHGMGGTAVRGSWTETQADGSKKEVGEDSYLIRRHPDVHPDKFKEIVHAAVKEYDQDAAVLGHGGKVHLLHKSGEMEHIGTHGKVQSGDVDGAYTRLKGYKVKVEAYKPTSFADAVQAEHEGIEY